MDHAAGNERIARLEQAIEAWRAQIQKGQAGLAGELHALQKAVTALPVLDRATEAANVELLSEFETKTEELAEGVAQREQLLEALREELAQRDEELAQRDKDLARRDEELASARKEGIGLQQDLLSARDALTGPNQELDALHREIASLKREIAESNTKLKAVQDQADKETTTDRVRLAEIDALRAELTRTRDELNKARHEATAGQGLAARVQELTALYEAERQRAETLNAQVRHHQEELQNVRSGADIELQIAQQERDEARNRRDAIQREVEMLRRVNASLSTPSTPPGAPTVEEMPMVVVDDAGHKRQLGDVLLELQLITPEQLQMAQQQQAKTPQRWVGSILIENCLVAEEIIAQVLARQYNFTFVRLTNEVVNAEATRLITGQLARRRMVLPVSASDDHVVLAMQNPLDLITIDDVSLATRRRVEPVVATPSDISSAIVRYYGGA